MNEEGFSETAIADPVTMAAAVPDAVATPCTQRFSFWPLSLLGLAIAVFAVVALSSAGRIDVVDGQTRYEVGRSLVEHGDSIVRDDDAWFSVFRGRNGARYTNYRLPHSLLASAAILLSDASGAASEGRRQFFFALSGAVLCALIAALYAQWFRRDGHAPLASLGWGAGGVFFTPVWYYGTTTFDDVLGTLIVLAAIYCAAWLPFKKPAYSSAGKSPGSRVAMLVGLLLGLAFNCKPPLALFTPVAIAALWRKDTTREQRRRYARSVLFYMALGVVAYGLYDLWKFPPSTWAALADAKAEYVSLWPGVPLAGFLSLLVSPGMGAPWYWPPLALAVGAIAVCLRRDGQPAQATHDAPARSVLGSDGQRWLSIMVALSSLLFLYFIGTIKFFSGEPAWGPRYLTPMFGVLWLFVPLAAARRRWMTPALLTASFAVQVLGLALEPMRFFTDDNRIAAEAFLTNPWTYFRFDRSQLLARPRQIYDVVTYDGPPPAKFTPAKTPTLPMIIYVKTDKRVHARDYQMLSSLRPWWFSYRHLPADLRPVDLRQALIFLSLTGAAGLGILALSFLPQAICCSLINSREVAKSQRR